MSDFHTLKVVHCEKFTPHIIQLLLRPDFPVTYAAGQYIMLGFEREDLKPFSIASAPREDGLIECHIRKQADSAWMERLFAVEPGDTLVMQGPKDQMQIQPAHQPIIFVAGGTGFAPMKALLDEYLKQNTEVPLHFYWGVRHSEDLYMHDQMRDLERKHGNLIYVPVISEDDPQWDGLTGLVHQQVLKDYPSLEHKTVFMCGPWPMIEAAKKDFSAAGLDPVACIH
ncbi:NAD(P)H-flavin reductase [Thiomicrorhabdus sp. zzn3]|uniref:NAD(P)H-flavin reductase n=1 Tax=Thiomicrorhabdus sp. zzn3 TaxID=3039775 RepID=UPI002436B252|nr:NAD(P)H-flavin reductase [Thiomicrorhabdus sp. zzn3]MDG6778863.1 NAD(P)H-flavin reductase [Thiomicrorhabdus sp. zzn3]